MTALRLARHTTGRRLVALFQGSYHGHFDGVLAQLGADGNAVPMAGGTPAGMTDDIGLLDYGDEEAALETLARLGDAVGGVRDRKDVVEGKSGAVSVELGGE